ncbi:MAG TPA: hypothetical protein VF399_08930 [bacterium]
MKKLLVLMFLGLAFIACDYAKEAVELNPDIEITWINPIGWYTYPGDSSSAQISDVYFVNENSLDCYLRELIYEYSDVYGSTPFFRSEPFPLYAKVEGIVERPYVDTTIINNLRLPLGHARTHMTDNGTHSVRALLKFVYSDELFEAYDTATVWFGIYMIDTTNSF